MALSSVVSEIFNVEKCRDLEIEVRGHSKSFPLEFGISARGHKSLDDVATRLLKKC